MHPAITSRRDDLDTACTVLRALLIVADYDHDALTACPAFMPTPTQARIFADACDDEAAELRIAVQDERGNGRTVVVCLASALQTHAERVRYAADALDRAIRAMSDDASAAADGASLVGAA